jgi:3-hydroxyisobutyrate dehydrogenase-like beta-hydroxyacid dehydrogenase
VTVPRVWLPGRPEAFGDLPDGVHAVDEMPEMLKNADVAVILLPVTDETRQLVGKDFRHTMKDGALLVNAARRSPALAGSRAAAHPARRRAAAECHRRPRISRVTPNEGVLPHDFH